MGEKRGGGRENRNEKELTMYFLSMQSALHGLRGRGIFQRPFIIPKGSGTGVGMWEHMDRFQELGCFCLMSHSPSLWIWNRGKLASPSGLPLMHMVSKG